MSEARAQWSRRVEAWRASGENADEFSRREGCSAGTLRWWATRLKREARSADVQLARVVRTPSTVIAEAPSDRVGVIVIEVTRTGTKIAVERGADRSSLAMVFELLGLVSTDSGARS